MAGIAVTGYLLRPLTCRLDTFKDSPLSTTALNKRLQHHLTRLGLFEGESSHGLRRGTVIHAYQEQGLSAYDVGMRLQHAQPGGPQTLQYLDTSRETERPSRKRRQQS